MDFTLRRAMFSFSLMPCFSLNTKLCTLKEESVPLPSLLSFHSFFGPLKSGFYSHYSIERTS